jgi:hypothetical protein
MTGTQALRPRSRLAKLALFVILPLVVATVEGVVHASPASAATRAQVVHLMDANGASVVDRGGHSGDHGSGDHHGDHSSDRHGDRSDRHDEGGDRHHDEGGDRHHDEGGDHNGAECHNCGIDNGDHREGGGGGDHNGDHHDGGERGSCAPKQESLFEALIDGLCTGAETLERALTGAK